MIVVAIDDMRNDVLFFENGGELPVHAVREVGLEEVTALFGAEDEMDVELVVCGHGGIGNRVRRAV